MIKNIFKYEQNEESESELLRQTESTNFHLQKLKNKQNS
jgi:hypothetical protein